MVMIFNLRRKKLETVVGHQGELKTTDTILSSTAQQQEDD
jgi:hypothetical protein|tara:strand:+ start:310 stop:429 length:120 start_codon:yes stop_codon:yes gene_type:complete